MNKSLSERLLDGDRFALSKILSEVDNATQFGEQTSDELYSHTGGAWIIGITGSPGSGKSTLVNSLALCLSEQGKKIAILAVDPSSPFSGGSILGDRVRMRDLYGKPNIFIRSVSSRGHLGGISSSTFRLARIFDAAGFDTILIETVGIGQNEIEVSKLAHTTIVVEAPGFGDEIQAIKAGILEIADILVVNKSDLPGSDATVSALVGMIDLGYPSKEEQITPWIPPIIKVSSSKGEGISELITLMDAHRDYMREHGLDREIETRAAIGEIGDEVERWVWEKYLNPKTNSELAALIAQIGKRELSPQAAARQLIGKLKL
ncbi:MAG TPA: methylmalonyl Co-A mutase-associated GTPase MeaB [Anaerolineales bacterium]|nr:methylmalonyl Co-A mutase-associated GTPase MeaB [Anaerolineales bacterium]